MLLTINDVYVYECCGLYFAAAVATVAGFLVRFSFFIYCCVFFFHFCCRYHCRWHCRWTGINKYTQLEMIEMCVCVSAHAHTLEIPTHTHIHRRSERSCAINSFALSNRCARARDVDRLYFKFYFFFFCFVFSIVSLLLFCFYDCWFCWCAAVDVANNDAATFDNGNAISKCFLLSIFLLHWFKFLY